MKKLKKLLVFLVLVVGCVCCFCSCSCSSKKAPDTTDPPDSGQDSSNVVYYNVTIVVHGNEGAGDIVSSTANNRHEAGTSPVYTCLPSAGYAIETITIDGAVEYTHLIDGFSEEPITVPISNISKDIQLAVTFKQMEYVVECNIVGDEDCGTVSSSTGGDTHLGATSPSYLVKPSEGYCVYSLAVDDLIVYDYSTQFVDNTLGATSEYILIEPFKNISKNHQINVEFRKLVDIDDVVISSTYYKNRFKAGEEEVQDDGAYGFTDMSLVTYEELKDYKDMPVGTTQKLKFEFNDIASRVFSDIRISFSFDGGKTFLSDFSWKGYFNNPASGVSYNPNTKVLSINKITENMQIKFVGHPMEIDLTIYNANEQTTVGTSKVYLFSDKENVGGDLYWYYCLSSQYHLPNLYIDANIEEIQVGDQTFYNIYLDESMLMLNFNDEYEARIVLIFSTSKLTD